MEGENRVASGVSWWRAQNLELAVMKLTLEGEEKVKEGVIAKRGELQSGCPPTIENQGIPT